jgi:hypothetical protein
MNTRVGASGTMNHQLMLGQLFQDVSQYALNRRLPGLHLPTTEIGSIVCQSELNVTHG